jgi:hypothetical protein
MDALFSLSDRLCAVAVSDRLDAYRSERWRRAVFEIGHQVGELGWRLRRR